MIIGHVCSMFNVSLNHQYWIQFIYGHHDFQHFEPIEYVTGVSKFLHVYKQTIPKWSLIWINSCLVQNQWYNFLHLIHRIKFAFLLEWKLDSTFMEILNYYKKKSIQYVEFFLKNTTNVFNNDIFYFIHYNANNKSWPKT